MKMSRRQYRIGELAKTLQIEKFVIRFWEKELGIKPHRSKGGQRYYEEKDFNTFAKVKELLYEKKFTLAGAKRQLQSMKKNDVKVIATQKSSNKPTCSCEAKLELLKKQLLKFKQSL